MSQLNSLIPLLKKADFDAIEAARDRICDQDLPELIAIYPQLENWRQKAALINLVQDHLDPRLQPVMQNFLTATDPREDEAIELAKAIALCHLERNLDNFMQYYNDRQLLTDRVHEYLRAAPRTTNVDGTGSRATEPRGAARSSNAALSHFPPPTFLQHLLNGLQVGGVLLILAGGAFLLIIWLNQNTLNNFRTRGVTVQARVTDKWQSGTTQCLGISFFDKNIFDGGELYLTEVCKFIPPESWQSLQVDDRAAVIFLPEDPQNEVIIAATLENPRLDPLRQYLWGSMLFLFGLFLLLVRRFGLWLEKR